MERKLPVAWSRWALAPACTHTHAVAVTPRTLSGISADQTTVTRQKAKRHRADPWLHATEKCTLQREFRSKHRRLLRIIGLRATVVGVVESIVMHTAVSVATQR